MNPKQRKILYNIFAMKTVSRPKLLEQVQYTQPTLYRIIDDCINENYITVSGIEDEERKGRPTELFSINAEIAYVFSIHIARTAFYTAAVNAKGDIESIKHHDIAVDLTPEDFVNCAEEDFNIYSAEIPLFRKKLCGIGLAVVGPLNYANGVMLNPLHFAAKGWENVPIYDLIISKFNVKTHFNCNAGAAVMGNYLPDYYERFNNIAYITLGTAIGSGLIVNKRLLRDLNVVTDGIAHMVIDIDGRKCSCGEYGCVEAYCSVNAILEQCVQAMKMGKQSVMCEKLDNLEFKDLCAAVQANDYLAKEKTNEAAIVFAKAIANYLRVANLEAVFIGGSIVEQLPSFFETVSAFIKAKKFDIQLIKAENEHEKILRGIANEVLIEHMF